MSVMNLLIRKLLNLLRKYAHQTFQISICKKKKHNFLSNQKLCFYLAFYCIKSKQKQFKLVATAQKIFKGSRVMNMKVEGNVYRH